MFKSLKNILIIIGVILLLLAVFKLTQNYYQGKLEKEQTEKRTAEIRNDSLRKIFNGYYKKLAADTLTTKELKKVRDSLKIKADNPRIITVMEFKPRDEQEDQPAQESSHKDSIYYLAAYYPQKENAFIKYTSKINFIDKTDEGRFTFPTPIKISMTVEEKEGGLFETSLNAPEFIEITEFNFQSLPLEPQKKDNFGWLAGAGYFKDINAQEEGIKLNAGLRYKKLYLIGSAQTNSTIGLSALIEF